MDESLTPNELLSRGDESFEKERYESALRDYDSVLKLTPDDAGIWVRRGHALDKLERPEEALAAFENALERDPKDVEAWIGKGRMLYFQDTEEALRAFENALELDPDHLSAWQGKGDALSFLFRTEDALAAYDSVLERDPSHVSAWLGKGSMLGFLSRYEEALTAYDSALECDSGNPIPWLGKANALLSLGHPEDALAAYENALQRDPDDNLSIWCQKGDALLSLGRSEEALDAYDRALALHPDDAFAWDKKGGALDILARYEEALTAYGRALELMPNHPYAWSHRGNALHNLDRYEEALDAHDRAIELDDNAETWIDKGRTLDGLGRYEEALDAFGRALERAPDYATAREYAELMRQKIARDEGEDVESKGADIEAEMMAMMPDDSEGLGSEGGGDPKAAGPDREIQFGDIVKFGPASLAKIFSEAGLELWELDRAFQDTPNYVVAKFLKWCRMGKLMFRRMMPARPIPREGVDLEVALDPASVSIRDTPVRRPQLQERRDPREKILDTIREMEKNNAFEQEGGLDRILCRTVDPYKAGKVNEFLDGVILRYRQRMAQFEEEAEEIVQKETYSLIELAHILIYFALRSKREGILALDSICEQRIKDAFLKESLRLALEGEYPDILRAKMDCMIEQAVEKERVRRQIMRDAMWMIFRGEDADHLEDLLKSMREQLERNIQQRAKGRWRELVGVLRDLQQTAIDEGISGLEGKLDDLDDGLRESVAFVIRRSDPEQIPEELENMLERIDEEQLEAEIQRVLQDVEDTWRELADVLRPLCETASREGILAIEWKLKDLDDFLREGLRLMMEGYHPELISTILNNRLEGIVYEERVRREMMQKGIVAIQSGDNDEVLTCLMKSMVGAEERDRIFSVSEFADDLYDAYFPEEMPPIAMSFGF